MSIKTRTKFVFEFVHDMFKILLTSLFHSSVVWMCGLELSACVALNNSYLTNFDVPLLIY